MTSSSPQPTPADDAPPAPVFAAAARYFGLLSDPTRLKILHAICRCERHVTAIVGETGASQTNVSRHLAVLREAGVVSRRKVRNTVFYRISDPVFSDVCATICAQLAPRRDGLAPRAGEPRAPGSPH
jgi:DNA-binding transcriptional ArsR family regulator